MDERSITLRLKQIFAFCTLRVIVLIVFGTDRIEICSQKDRHHLLYVLRRNRFESQLICGTLELSTEKLSKTEETTRHILAKKTTEKSGETL